MLPRPPYPRPSAQRAAALCSALDRRLGTSKVISDADALVNYAGDESEQAPVTPDAVVLATSADDIAGTLAVCDELAMPVTPRAGGSGKSGGAVPVCGGVVLCTMGMNTIKEIDRREHLVVAEPGIILGDLFDAVEAEGLFFPPDPNSHAMCALGGAIAENAAGPRAFKYGVTRDYVLGLDVLTAEGTALSVGRRTRKGVTGYDLTALLVGSEGTLAITTSATLRLIRKPASIITLLGLFASVEACAAAVESIVAAGLAPRCLELIDEACLAAMRAEGVAISDEARAMLIMEVDGEPAECERGMEDVGQRAIDAGAIDVLVAQDAAKRDRLWGVRRELSNVIRRLARSKISEDVVVPRVRMVDLVKEVMRISEETGVRMLNYGHAGDGNLHVNLLWDDDEEVPKVQLALDRLFASVIDMRGTLSGEHGIGTSKSAYLPLEQSDALIRLQERIKAQFDPRGILNPGKIFPRRGHGNC